MISPRTSDKCGIEKTAWWELCVNHKSFDELTDSKKETVKRIFGEPESILYKDK